MAENLKSTSSIVSIHEVHDQAEMAEAECRTVVFIKQVITWPGGELAVVKLMQYLKTAATCIKHVTGVTEKSVRDFVKKNNWHFHIGNDGNISVRKGIKTQTRDQFDYSDDSEVNSGINKDTMKSTELNAENTTLNGDSMLKVTECAKYRDTVPPNNIKKDEMIYSISTDPGISNASIRDIDSDIAYQHVDCNTKISNAKSNILGENISSKPPALSNDLPDHMQHIPASGEEQKLVKALSRPDTVQCSVLCNRKVEYQKTYLQSGTISEREFSHKNLDEKAVAFIKEIIHKKGTVSLERLTGYFSQASEEVRKIAGVNPEGLRRFGIKYSTVFHISSDNMISLVVDTTAKVTMKKLPVKYTASTSTKDSPITSTVLNTDNAGTKDSPTTVTGKYTTHTSTNNSPATLTVKNTDNAGTKDSPTTVTGKYTANTSTMNSPMTISVNNMGSTSTKESSTTVTVQNPTDTGNLIDTGLLKEKPKLNVACGGASTSGDQSNSTDSSSDKSQNRDVTNCIQPNVASCNDHVKRGDLRMKDSIKDKIEIKDTTTNNTKPSLTKAENKAVCLANDYFECVLKNKGPMQLVMLTAYICQAPVASIMVLRAKFHSIKDYIKCQTDRFYIETNTNVVVSIDEAKKNMHKFLKYVLIYEGPTPLKQLVRHMNSAQNEVRNAEKSLFVSSEEFIRNWSYAFYIDPVSDMVSLLDGNLLPAVEYFVSVIKIKGPMEMHCITGHINQAPGRQVVWAQFNTVQNFLRKMNNVFIVKNDVMSLVKKEPGHMSKEETHSNMMSPLDRNLHLAVEHFVKVIKIKGPMEMYRITGHINQAPGRQVVWAQFNTVENFLRKMNNVFIVKNDVVSLVKKEPGHMSKEKRPMPSSNQEPKSNIVLGIPGISADTKQKHNCCGSNNGCTKYAQGNKKKTTTETEPEKEDGQIYNCKGYIDNLLFKCGFIYYGSNGKLFDDVYFDVSVCDENIWQRLDFDDKVSFNAVLNVPDGLCKWKATKVWLPSAMSITLPNIYHKEKTVVKSDQVETQFQRVEIKSVAAEPKYVRAEIKSGIAKAKYDSTETTSVTNESRYSTAEIKSVTDETKSYKCETKYTTVETKTAISESNYVRDEIKSSTSKKSSAIAKTKSSTTQTNFSKSETTSTTS